MYDFLIFIISNLLIFAGLFNLAFHHERQKLNTRTNRNQEVNLRKWAQ